MPKALGLLTVLVIAACASTDNTTSSPAERVAQQITRDVINDATWRTRTAIPPTGYGPIDRAAGNTTHQIGRATQDVIFDHGNHR